MAVANGSADRTSPAIDFSLGAGAATVALDQTTDDREPGFRSGKFVVASMAHDDEPAGVSC